MKRLKFLTFLFCGLLISCSTTKTLVNFPEPIIKTYDVDGSQDELFLRANRWMISIFKDARSIIQYSDKVQGVLIGKYLLHYPQSLMDGYAEVYAIIEIKVKEGKALISIKPEDWSYITSNYGIPYWTGTQDKYIYTKEKAIDDINTLCENFYNYLKTSEIKF